MNRRFFALALLIGGAALIVGVLLWMFWPTLQKPSGQATPLIPQKIEQGPAGPTLVKPKPAQKSVETSAAQKEQMEKDFLTHLSMDFAARSASYSNADGFASIRDVFVNASLELQTSLTALQKQLIKDHPASQGSWGQTTRSVAARIATFPVAGKLSEDVTVDVQQTVTASGVSTTGYAQIVITFQRDTALSAWKAVKMTSRALAK